jgi:hypothetical protein
MNPGVAGAPAYLGCSKDVSAPLLRSKRHGARKMVRQPQSYASLPAQKATMCRLWTQCLPVPQQPSMARARTQSIEAGPEVRGPGEC